MKLGTVGIEDDKVFEVEKPFANVLVIGKLNAAIYASFRDDESYPSTQDIIAELESHASKSIISAEYIRRDGQRERIMNAQQILTMAEFSQHKEGTMITKNDGANGYLYMMVTLSSSGAIPFNGDETLRLTVTNKGDLFESLDLHTLESPLQATDRLQYNTLSVGDLKEKEFDLRQTDKVMIPLNEMTSSTELHFTYTNGRTTKFKLPEIVGIGMAINDSVMNIEGRVIGGNGRFVIIDTAMVEKLEVIRQATTPLDFISVHSKLLDTADVAEQSNSKLVDASVRYVIEKTR